jgi:hypothetical protein
MKTLILMVMLLAAPVLAQPTSGKPGSYTLLGSLGQSYLIRMELERSGDVFRGSYRYERPGVVRPGSNSIGLTGSIDSGGNLQLIETAEVSGRPGSPGRLEVVRTGEFNGRLITTTANGQSLLHLAGTWTRSRDGRRMPFSLDQLRLNFGNDQLTSREEKEEQKPLNYGVRLNLPVLGAPESKFNRHLAAIVNPLAADFRKATSVCVRKATIHAGGDRATLEFSTEEFAADALKLSGITVIQGDVTLARPPDFIALEKVQDMLNRGGDPMAASQAQAEKAGACVMCDV